MTFTNLEQDRGYGGGGGGGRRDDYGPRVDRYRDDRYGGERGGSGGGDRRGGYGYDRAPRGPPAERSGGYGAEPSGGAPPPPRDYDDRPRRAYD